MTGAQRAADTLGLLLEREGHALIDQSPRFRALMKDLCPDAVRETHLLVTALQAGVPADLLGARNAAGIGATVSRLAIGLADRFGFDRDAARWAVETWAHALKLDGALPRHASMGASDRSVDGAIRATQAGNASVVPPAASASARVSDRASVPGRRLRFALSMVCIVGVIGFASFRILNQSTSPKPERGPAAYAPPTPPAPRVSGPTPALLPTADCRVVLPQSSTRVLQPGDIAPLSRTELRIARNEIYARHGRRFTSPDMRAYFTGCSWYLPSTSSVVVSPLEQANAESLLREERRRR